MKYLIKQYPHFLGEIFRHIKVFPNSLNCFYQSNDLTPLRLLKEIIDSFSKASRNNFSVGFFVYNTHKMN